MSKETLIPFLQGVEKFHRLFNHPVADSPVTLEANRKRLRFELIKEENEELGQAMIDENLVEIADALGDLLYVLGGAILEHGLQDAMPEVFAEIQRSNMSKACKTQKEVGNTILHYGKKDIQCYSKGKILSDGTQIYLVYRESDNKIMKSINYSPANLKPIIDKYIK